MKEETLQKVRDAGFPFMDTDEVRVPDLSDLISACGEDFRNLVLHTQFKKTLEQPWDAVPNKKRRPEVKGQKGDSPDEAVAKLWLALQ